MSGALENRVLENRAAVFTTSPQIVEVYQQGAWWPGSLLGWRHGVGGCQMWVRVEVGGVSETAWTDLTALRLPDDRREGRPVVVSDASRGVPAPAAGSAATTAYVATTASATTTASASITHVPDCAETQHLPLVRERAGAPSPRRRVPPSGGRSGSAPAGEAASGGLLIAGESTDAATAPGRHRAPAPSGAAAGRHRAIDPAATATADGGPSAKPADRGSSAVPAQPADRGSSAVPGSWTPPPARSQLPPAGPVVRPRPSRAEHSPDGLTRPMRLDEAVGTVRRSRRDSFSGA